MRAARLELNAKQKDSLMTRTTKKEFTIKVGQIPAVRVLGIKVRTTMHDAPADCAKLWHETFMPRMQEVPGGNGTAYGISEVIDIEAGIFDYWAAMATTHNANTPAGMETLDLPAGLYAQCRVESLADIKAAYDFLCYEWLPAQKEYAPDYTARCYEFYPVDYPNSGVFYIFVRVNEK